MDTQGRGHAGDIDPADQWVFNPDTGSYELRLNPVGATPPGPRAGRHSDAPHRRSSAAPEEARVPEQRRRDARPQEQTGRAQGRAQARAQGRRGAGTGSGRRRPKPAPSGRQKVLRWGGAAAAMLLVAGCTGVYVLYENVNGDLETFAAPTDPATSDGPLNILLIGTDARTGEGNEGYGDAGSVGHADTTLLFHVSKDRSNATVMSIPRDLVTDIPDCTATKEDGSQETVAGQQGVRFNTSLGQAGRGPDCALKTVQDMTGLKINHLMLADFNAVKEMSTAVGGVEVCVAKDIDDPKSKLKLSAGRHTVEGEQALAFVRTRSSVGFGSDLSRIELQQQFLGSMMRTMKSGDTLTDPGKLYDLAKAATGALTVDESIGSVAKLVDLAKDLRRIGTDNITFATVPVLDNPADPASVILDEPKAKQLFSLVQADKSLTKTKKSGEAGKKDAERKPVEKAPAEEVRVDVLNGGGPSGAAQTTVSWLQVDKGVPLSTNAGNAPGTLDRTRLEYAPNQADQAATLAEMMGLPDGALKKTGGDAADGEAMTLTLGADFTEPGTPLEVSEKALADVPKINAADKNVCAK